MTLMSSSNLSSVSQNRGRPKAICCSVWLCYSETQCVCVCACGVCVCVSACVRGAVCACARVCGVCVVWCVRVVWCGVVCAWVRAGVSYRRRVTHLVVWCAVRWRHPVAQSGDSAGLPAQRHCDSGGSFQSCTQHTHYTYFCFMGIFYRHNPSVSQARLKPSPRLKCKYMSFFWKKMCVYLNSERQNNNKNSRKKRISKKLWIDLKLNDLSISNISGSQVSFIQLRCWD